MLKLQYFGHLMGRDDSLEKTLVGKDWGQQEKKEQKMRWLGGITNSMDISLSKLWETVKQQGSLARCNPWGPKESDLT